MSKEITCQEAWDKIVELMIKEDNLTYFINPWNEDDEHKYCLQTIINGKMINILSTDKEWKR